MENERTYRRTKERMNKNKKSGKKLMRLSFFRILLLAVIAEDITFGESIREVKNIIKLFGEVYNLLTSFDFKGPKGKSFPHDARFDI